MYNKCEEDCRDNFLANSLADLIITEYICYHIFHKKLSSAPALQKSNPAYSMLRTFNDSITEGSENLFVVVKNLIDWFLSMNVQFQKN